MNRAIMVNMICPLAIMLMVLLPISTSALTTFGKTNPQNQNQPPPPPTPENDCSHPVVINTTFARYTSMGRSGGGRSGAKTGHLGHSFGNAKGCKTEQDCIPIQNTSCVADPKDHKTKCLCGDFSVPINGLCTNKWKAVNAPCNDHAECGEGAHCVQSNHTMIGKKCQCMDGYWEENNRCNGSQSLFQNSSLLVLIISFILLRQTSCT